MSRFLRTASLIALLASAASAQDCLNAPVSARTAAVERSLSPAVVLAGTPAHRRTIASEMRRLHVPGVSVAVMRGGVLDWAKGYGVTQAGGAAVTPETLFQAGSISKPVTALAALRLVWQGRLSLEGDVNNRLVGWKLPVPPGVHVSLRELLSHTAGATVHGFPGYAAGAPVPSVEDVLAGRSPANTAAVVVDTAPGTIWRYSGGGYTVVQKLIGDVTGRPFDDVLRDEVLRPAGMAHSSFAQPLGAASLAGAAMPSDASGKPVPGGPHTYPELAAAGLWTTPSDLLRFAVAVRDSAGGKQGALLDRSLAAQMLTPGRGDWGLGLEIHGSLGDRDFSHGGSNEGYENFLVAFTGSGDGVAVMTDGAQGSELALEITRSVAASYGWPRYRSVERTSIAIPPATRDRMIGTYAIPDLGTFDITGDGTGLAVSLKEGTSEPLYASGPDTFFVLSTNMVLHVDKDAATVSGRIVSGSFDVPFRKTS